MNCVPFFIFSLCVFFYSCNGTEDPSSDASETSSRILPKQLNINILWDLSDRIDSTKNPASPQHYQRDIEIINQFVRVFKKDMDDKGAYSARGKIKVFFTPSPENWEINNIAKNLSKDLSIYQGEGSSIQKKKIYDEIADDFAKNTHTIYQLAIKANSFSKNWEGSDIWRFFKNDVDRCIENDTNYRNILVILTDGYLYHKDSKEQLGNRSQYILPSTLAPFRKNPNWRQLFERKNYGLISTRKDLNNLEILVLEVSPSQENRNDEDYIKAYLTKWFDEMSVQKYKIYNTDLPEHTKKRIETFLAGES